MKLSLKFLVLTLTFYGMVAQTASALITIETVPVGNAGNANYYPGYGAVGYDYSIGKYEVTLNQYTAFLNAVGATDSYGLYNAGMSTDLNIAGISRTGVSGSYNYSVIGSGARPVTYVSWYDSARFVNWLHNGQQTGLQNASTTEQGVYTLNGAVSGIITRNSNLGWTYGLPSEDEWFKAAYYDQSMNSGIGGYWMYADRNSDLPHFWVGYRRSNANYFLDDFNPSGINNGYYLSRSPIYSVSEQYLTDVGVIGVDSFYGTRDQGGNVWEWNDAVIGLERGLRGGSWADGINDQEFAVSNRSRNNASEGSTVGFRIVIVPEPSVIGLMALGVVLLVRKRK